MDAIPIKDSLTKNGAGLGLLFDANRRMLATIKPDRCRKIVASMSLPAPHVTLADEGDTLMVELGEILSNNLQELRSKLFLRIHKRGFDRSVARKQQS